MRSHTHHATILAICLASAGCSGEIGEPGGARAGGNAPESHQPGTTGGQSAGGGNAAQPGPFVAAPGGLLRLTQSQYRNSLRDLFGDWLTMPSDLEADLVEEGFSSVGAARVSTSSQGVEKYNTAAMAVAAQAMSTTRRASFVGCTPSSSTDPCIATFLQRFGRRVFRRPLIDEEVKRYADVASSVATTFGGDVWKGLELTVAGLLQSPAFLYQAGIGETDPTNASRLRRTSFEVASRLSFFLVDSTPDDALLDAADKGELYDVAKIRPRSTGSWRCLARAKPIDDSSESTSTSTAWPTWPRTKRCFPRTARHWATRCGPRSTWSFEIRASIVRPTFESSSTDAIRSSMTNSPRSMVCQPEEPDFIQSRCPPTARALACWDWGVFWR